MGRWECETRIFTEGALRRIYLELERLAEEITYLEKLKAPELRSAPVTPELRAWARLQHTDQEVLARYNEMKEVGGLELSEFIQDLEKPAAGTPAS